VKGFMHFRQMMRLLFFLTVLATTAVAADEGRVYTADDFLQGRVPRCSASSERISMLIEVNAKLPPYRFTLIREPEAAADGVIHHAGRIEISRPGTEQILQTIEVRSNWNDSVCLFEARDVNFDGYLDIFFIREGNGTWGSRDYYLFDAPSGRFIANDLTDDLDQLQDNGLEIDWKTREIRAHFLAGLCGGKDIYRITNGRLVKTQEDTVRIDTGGNRCVQTVRERVNGKWKVLRVETTEIPRLD